ncbi:hypothetical protein GF312_18680 [Candidatus Poribacteria bacterium]|nr:hypothetical protein [Candidatus Poribacteria bacterium]
MPGYLKERDNTMKITKLLCFFSIFISLLFATICSAKIDPDTIVGLWLFDEGKGDEAKDDVDKYDGQLEGNPEWVDGKFGKALKFSGSDYIELKDSGPDLHFGGTAAFTITAWVQSNGGGTVIGKFNGGVIGAYIVTITGGIVGFHREVAPWGLSGTKALPAGDFGHLAVTYDGAEMKIYVNGELDTTQKRPAQNTDTATPVLIGARLTNGNPSDFFRGVLDEVALFNVALTEDQIKEVMKGLSPKLQPVSAMEKLMTKWGAIKTAY